MMKKYILILMMGLFVTACSDDGGGSPSPNPAPPSKKPTPEQSIQACPANADQTQCQSFLMTLKGKDSKPPNANDLKFVANVVGGLVSDLKAQNYILLQMFPEGGFQACLDPIANGGYDAAAYAFSTFRVGSETSWDITTVKGCTGGGQ